MNREARIWRRLALAGAGTVALLTARVLGMPPLRLPHPDAETRDEEVERRLHACEASIQNLWEAHNARGPGNG